jgi:hypothetical protein
MTHNAASAGAQKKAWAKPELTHLGKIGDVAGPGPNPVQNLNNS